MKTCLRLIKGIKIKSCLLLLLALWRADSYSQLLVLPGDHPDPSVVKIGDAYWASATTSNWFPAFPLLKSKDLIHWELKNYVFTKMPDWADYYFWAPELSYDKGKIYVYYAAHKKNGNLCIGIAKADRPEGPYTDLGPLECQEDGSIDAFPMRDEQGKLFLIWKEDANSVHKPTPIWAQELNESRTALIGPKTELFRNTAPWEGNLVEGVSILKHGLYYYAFYAASGCCGISCTYAVGVARAKNLLGPWEKYSGNPVMTNNSTWVCPGHGTPIEKNGRFFFLHHAYNKSTIPFTGREGLLSEFRFTEDGWIEFIKHPTNTVRSKTAAFVDPFAGQQLKKGWQWSVFEKVRYQISNGTLQLQAQKGAGAYIGQEIVSGNYTATTLVDGKHSNAQAGIGILGDEKNIVAVLFKGHKVVLSQFKEGKEDIIEEQTIPETENIFLQLQVGQSRNLHFSYSLNGKDYHELNRKAIDATFIPPWDRAVRVGLISRGNGDESASFKKFVLVNH
jgi:xylan 1,4-beta-xylosidase